MSNHKKVNPTVEIDLDSGKGDGTTEKVTLKFDLWALMKIEEITGLNALDGATWLRPRAKDVVALLWAAMLHSKPELKIDDVAKRINLNDVGSIVEKLVETFEAASPPEDPAKKNDAGPETMTTPEAAQPTG